MEGEKPTFVELYRQHPFNIDDMANTAYVSRQGVVDMMQGEPVILHTAQHVLEVYNRLNGTSYALGDVIIPLRPVQKQYQ